MKTRRSISIDFNNAIAQAKKLEADADQMRAAQRQLTESKNALRQAWEGESASLYLDKCEKMSSKLTQTAKDLDQIASVIRRSAKSYRDAELKALEAVQTKSM